MILNNLKEAFKRVLSNEKEITRWKLIRVKEIANHCSPEISSALAHILKGTVHEIDVYKIKKLKQLYKDHFH